MLICCVMTARKIVISRQLFYSAFAKPVSPRVPSPRWYYSDNDDDKKRTHFLFVARLYLFNSLHNPWISAEV